MLREFQPQSIPDIREAAGMAIQSLVLEKARGTESFPTTQLRGENGNLKSCAGVVVDFGVPKSNEGRVQIAERDAVVLLPKGLFVGKPVETPREDRAYSMSVPAVGELRPASIKTYRDYGERALKLLEDTIEAQFSR